MKEKILKLLHHDHFTHITNFEYYIYHDEVFVTFTSKGQTHEVIYELNFLNYFHENTI